MIGTGSIVGVAATIFLGGPGAVFWMWMNALVGMGAPNTQLPFWQCASARPMKTASMLADPFITSKMALALNGNGCTGRSNLKARLCLTFGRYAERAHGHSKLAGLGFAQLNRL